MQLKFLLLGVLASLGESKKSTLCYTHLANTAAAKAVTTSTSTSLTACTTTSTFTSTVTQTPTVYSTVSTTVTKKTTLYGATSTNTLIITTNTLAYTTETSTETDTATSSTTSTSTIAAPSGFLPIQSTLPGSSYNSSASDKKRRAVRDIRSRNLLQQRASSPLQGKHAAGVDCLVLAASACKTKSTTVKVTNTASPVTATKTYKTTVTSTVVTSAVGTVTTTTTETFTSYSSTTTTVTTTSTSTAVYSTSAYAACATNNIVNYYNNAPIANFHEDGNAPDTSDAINTDNAYDCCVAAQMHSGYVQAFEFYDGQCIIAYAGPSGPTCGSGSQSQNYSPFDNAYGTEFFLGNAFCGEVVPASS